jgi:hypothetical protein
MKTIKGTATYLVDGKEVYIISKEYTGSPIIAHKPDLLLISKETYDRYKSQILFRDKLRIIFI